MAYRVSWSPEALEDLEAIALFIERDSPQYARAVVRKLMAMGRSLSEFAERGRIVPELDEPNTRERFVHSYRLIYRVAGQHVTIAAVVHGRRLLGNALACDDTPET